MTLVEWLTAILDEDERVARAAIVLPGRVGEWEVRRFSPRARLLPSVFMKGEIYHVVTEVDDDTAQHIALHDPAAVLADIAAKRAILALHRRLGEVEDEGDMTYPLAANSCACCGSGDHWSYREGERADNDPTWAPCSTLRLLASAYAHRDGFDPSWV